ncbi:hypothetical protein [Streptomyces sp. NBC_00882]|uniref:MmyB family transcriptional regulator n=1 Tax=Streptomyces TaxID=1883 RepID=UPI00386C8D37
MRSPSPGRRKAPVRTILRRIVLPRGLDDLLAAGRDQELSTHREEFRTRWGAHDVRHHGTGTNRFHHQAVGDLTLAFEGLEMAAQALHQFIHNAHPGRAHRERRFSVTRGGRPQRRLHQEAPG